MVDSLGSKSWRAGYVEVCGCFFFRNSGLYPPLFRVIDNNAPCDRLVGLFNAKHTVWNGGLQNVFTVTGKNFLDLFSEIRPIAPFRNLAFGPYLDWWRQSKHEKEKAIVYGQYVAFKEQNSNPVFCSSKLSDRMYVDSIRDPNFVAGVVDSRWQLTVLSDLKGRQRHLLDVESFNFPLIKALHCDFLGSISKASKGSWRLTLTGQDLVRFRDFVEPYLQLNSFDVPQGNS